MRDREKKLETRVRDSRGETLVECLITLLIVVLAGMLLAGSIVSSDRLNHSVANSERAAMFPKYQAENQSAADTIATATLSGDLLKQASGQPRESRPASGSVGLGSVTIHMENGGLVYYEKN
ncbi:MAG: hypothetical protein IJU66_09545 [Oscillospiraceae bacterium]|nr:hypothetical protein [Oscillospiraceae bacterium]